MDTPNTINQSLKQQPDIEICVDSLSVAMKAIKTQRVQRLEVCSNLAQGGGTTPSHSIVKHIIAASRSKVQVYCMIRPRIGSFVYTNEEFQQMLDSAREFSNLGVDGIVFGILTPEGTIDAERCKEMIKIHPKATFHRAFDLLNSDALVNNLEILINTKFTRILSSGCSSTAEKGLKNLNILLQNSKNRIEIQPGCGLCAGNIGQFLAFPAIHFSCHILAEPPLQFGFGARFQFDQKKFESIWKKIVQR